MPQTNSDTPRLTACLRANARISAAPGDIPLGSVGWFETGDFRGKAVGGGWSLDRILRRYFNKILLIMGILFVVQGVVGFTRPVELAHAFSEIGRAHV